MQIHVFESTSSKPVARQMARHNLALCMLAMGELAKCFLSATAAYKLFETAIQKVEKARENESESEGPVSGATPDGVSLLPALPSPSPVATAVGGKDGMDKAQASASTTEPWENWPEGYLTSTASVITDVWLPCMNGAGTW